MRHLAFLLVLPLAVSCASIDTDNMVSDQTSFGGNHPASVALRRSIRNGERIYHRLCYHCHGRRGKGDNNEYMASIGHKPADHSDLRAMQTLSDDEFFVALRDGVKDDQGWLTMPPWSSVLTTAEMWDVIAYVRRLPLAPIPSGQISRERPESPPP